MTTLEASWREFRSHLDIQPPPQPLSPLERYEGSADDVEDWRENLRHSPRPKFGGYHRSVKPDSHDEQRRRVKVGHRPPPKLQSGEIPFKQWTINQAEREQVNQRTVARRLWAGKYPGIKVRKSGPRLIFVTVPLLDSQTSDHNG